MLEAYLIVPALLAVYLFAAPLAWRTRILHLLGFAAILLAVSLSWVTVVDLIPAASRPWVGSTSTNSELDLALGYNGIERLLGMFSGSGSGSSLFSATSVGGPGGVSENGPIGLFRLFNTELGGQASWLLPLGLIGLLASGWAFNALAFARALPERIRLWRASPEAPPRLPPEHAPGVVGPLGPVDADDGRLLLCRGLLPHLLPLDAGPWRRRAGRDWRHRAVGGLPAPRLAGLAAARRAGRDGRRPGDHARPRSQPTRPG